MRYSILTTVLLDTTAQQGPRNSPALASDASSTPARCFLGRVTGVGLQTRFRVRVLESRIAFFGVPRVRCFPREYVFSQPDQTP